MARETLPHESSSHELDDALEERFINLLEVTAEQLQIMTSPDETTQEIRHMAFGRTEEDLLTISHTNNLGYHSGTISYLSRSALGAEQNERRNFIYTNTLNDGMTWRCNESRYQANHVLSLIARHWPVGINNESLEKVLSESEPVDADHPANDIPVDSVLKVIEDYSILQNTGERSYEHAWTYVDTRYDNIGSKNLHHPALAFTVICNDETFDLKQIRADLAVPYRVDGVEVPLTYHVHIDELGKLFVGASYQDPTTKTVCSPTVKNHNGCYELVQLFIGKLVEEKLEYTRQVRL